MPNELDDKIEAQQQALATDDKSNRFQTQFDRLLALVLVLGLLLTIVYGASASTCQPDPQQLLPTAAARAAPAGAQATPAAAAAPVRQAAGLRPPCVGDGSRLVGALLALVIAFAALAIGTFAGFLFGLPRTLTSSEVRAVRQQAVSASMAPGQTGGGGLATSSTGAGSGSDVNTNLERISDWLTTMIVGVGLTKLDQIGPGIESFGDRIAPYFGYGGKIFGIAGGLFFLIAGFFLSYVGTRVKLSLVFVWSQRTNQGAASQSVLAAQAVLTSQAASPIPVAGSPEQGDETLIKADQLLLSRTLSDLKSPDEIVAWANAKARSGDFASALAAYKDVLGRLPLTEKLQTDYATVLAASGDTAGANNVVASMATTGLAPDAEREARQKVAAATQAGQTAMLRTRLQQGLYRPGDNGYEDSILAGKELFERSEPDTDGMAHVWLASAYGQKHAALKRAAAAPPTPAQQKRLDDIADLAFSQVETALRLDPTLKDLLVSLYDPARQIGNDNDLQSLQPRLDSLLKA